MKKVMVFGTFDGIHEGHRAFFREARAYGGYLIAVVAQDHVVERLKGKLPVKNLAARFAHLEKEDHVDEVVVGDHILRTWGVIEKYHPDVIALGYDQTYLREDLEGYFENKMPRPEIKIMSAYEPNVYHNSLGKDY